MKIKRPTLDKTLFKEIKDRVFIYNDDLDILQAGTTISRYMDLDSFLNIMNGRYSVNPRAYFSDRYEQGEFGLKNFTIFTIYGDKVTEAQEEAHKKKLNQWKLLREWNASCFTLNKSEDFLFWRIYTTSRFGIKTETTIEKLTNSITSIPEGFEIYFGRIKYGSDLPYDDINIQAFEKTWAYKNEAELRMYVIQNEATEIDSDLIDVLNPKPVYLKVNSEKIFNRVTLSPFINKEFANRLASHIKSTYPNIQISKSIINEK